MSENHNPCLSGDHLAGEHEDVMELLEQVRGPHAPDPTSWTAAADASIRAAAALAATRSDADRWAQVETRSGIRERRAVLVDQLVADARRAGAAQERHEAAQRVYAWAANLSDLQERLVACEAAKVVEEGR